MSGHIATEGLNPDIKANYDKKWKRFQDTLELKQPDKIPVSMIAGFWYAKYGGISCRDLMYDFKTSNEISVKAITEMDPDVCLGAAQTAHWGPVMEAIDYKQLDWPGHGAPENSSYQYIDREYMTAEEYDDFIFDPTGYLYETYLPRCAGAYEGLRHLGGIAGNPYFGIPASSFGFSLPPAIEAFEQMRKAGVEAGKTFASIGELTNMLAQKGYPVFGAGGTQAPYDVLADFMRGAKNMMKDLFRRPDKVLEALDKISSLVTKRVLQNYMPGNSNVVVIPIHWAADNFMSLKQFEKFFWPPLKKMMLKMIDNGIVPMPLWEADCTSRLELISDMPAGKCVYWFESTNMIEATKHLGGKIAIHGNVQASVMATGSPDDVDASVRFLVENVANKGGNLILSTSSPIPDETPIENVRALFAAARKYG